jgi:hypothetical protein
MLKIVYLIFILRDIFFYCFQHILPLHALYLISNNTEETVVVGKQSVAHFGYFRTRMSARHSLCRKVSESYGQLEPDGEEREHLSFYKRPVILLCILLIQPDRL